MVGLAIHHGERSCIDVTFFIKTSNQLVESFEVSVIFSRFERIDYNGMNLAVPGSAGFLVGFPMVGCFFAHSAGNLIAAWSLVRRNPFAEFFFGGVMGFVGEDAFFCPFAPRAFLAADFLDSGAFGGGALFAY